MFKYNKLRKEYLNDTLKLLKNAGVNCNDMAKILDIPLTSVINNEEAMQWRKEVNDD